MILLNFCKKSGTPSREGVPFFVMPEECMTAAITENRG